MQPFVSFVMEYSIINAALFNALILMTMTLSVRQRNVFVVVNISKICISFQIYTPRRTVMEVNSLSANLFHDRYKLGLYKVRVNRHNIVMLAPSSASLSLT